MRLAVIAATALLALCVVAAGNPIPDDVIIEMNDLARRWPEGIDEQERARLVDHMGRYHFRFWDADVRELIADNVSAYLPVLLESQEPGHAVDIGFHRWFRDVANHAQRAAMCAVLRRWLTEEMTAAPPDGAMQITGPEEDVRGLIMHGRVKAAEVLSDYGDTGAADMMERLLEVAASEPEPWDAWGVARRGSWQWHLRQALARLRDPEKGYLLRQEPEGTYTLVADLQPVIRACFGQPFSPFYEPMPVDTAAARTLFETLEDSNAAEERVRGLYGVSLDVLFADGSRAQISIGHHQGELVYEDNMRAEHPWVSLINLDLYRRLEQIMRSDEYAIWRAEHPTSRRMPN